MARRQGGARGSLSVPECSPAGLFSAGAALEGRICENHPTVCVKGLISVVYELHPDTGFAAATLYPSWRSASQTVPFRVGASEVVLVVGTQDQGLCRPSRAPCSHPTAGDPRKLGHLLSCTSALYLLTQPREPSALREEPVAFRVNKRVNRGSAGYADGRPAQVAARRGGQGA